MGNEDGADGKYEVGSDYRLFSSAFPSDFGSNAKTGIYSAEIQTTPMAIAISRINSITSSKGYERTRELRMETAERSAPNKLEFDGNTFVRIMDKETGCIDYVCKE